MEHPKHIIEHFRKSYYKAGAALAEIRDRRLYRARHASFEAYVAERWEISRPRAYDLIDASRVANNLSAVADVTTTDEFQTVLGKQFRAMVEKSHYFSSPEDVVRFSKLNDIEMLQVAKRLKQDWIFGEALDETSNMLLAIHT